MRVWATLRSQVLWPCFVKSFDLFAFYGGRVIVPNGPGPPQSRCFYITHNDAPQSVGLLWTSNQIVTKTSTCQHTTLTTDRHPCIRWDSNPQSQQVNGRRPTPQSAQSLGPTDLFAQSLIKQGSTFSVWSLRGVYEERKISACFKVW